MKDPRNMFFVFWNISNAQHTCATLNGHEKYMQIYACAYEMRWIMWKKEATLIDSMK